MSTKEFRSLEIKVISAKDLKYVNLLTKMNVYAVVMINADRRTAQRTPIDKDRGSNPEWNYTMNFTVEETAAQQNRLHLIFRLKSDRQFGNKVIGEVNVPLKDLIDHNSGNGKVEQNVSYSVRLPNGKAKGILNFSYKFGEKFEKAVAPKPQPMHVDRAAMALACPPAAATGYPGPSAGGYPPPPGPGVYPPPPQGMTHYPYPPPAGYPPQPQYGCPTGHAPAAAPAPGYGYPGPAYGYPAPSQSQSQFHSQGGYGYTSPMQKPQKPKPKTETENSGCGGGLGTALGVAGGLVAGLLIGEMVEDAVEEVEEAVEDVI